MSRSAFSGASLQKGAVSTGRAMSRTPVVSVQAVQDLKGTVVSTACAKTLVVGKCDETLEWVREGDNGP